MMNPTWNSTFHGNQSEHRQQLLKYIWLQGWQKWWSNRWVYTTACTLQQSWRWKLWSKCSLTRPVRTKHIIWWKLTLPFTQVHPLWAALYVWVIRSPPPPHQMPFLTRSQKGFVSSARIKLGIFCLFGECVYHYTLEALCVMLYEG